MGKKNKVVLDPLSGNTFSYYANKIIMAKFRKTKDYSTMAELLLLVHEIQIQTQTRTLNYQIQIVYIGCILWIIASIFDPAMGVALQVVKIAQWLPYALTPLTWRIEWLDRECYINKDFQNIDIVDSFAFL